MNATDNAQHECLQERREPDACVLCVRVRACVRERGMGWDGNELCEWLGGEERSARRKERRGAREERRGEERAREERSARIEERIGAREKRRGEKRATKGEERRGEERARGNHECGSRAPSTRSRRMRMNECTVLVHCRIAPSTDTTETETERYEYMCATVDTECTVSRGAARAPSCGCRWARRPRRPCSTWRSG